MLASATALACFDDIPAACLVSPALTTVTQFHERIGRRAAAMALERLRGTVSDEERCEEMPFELVIRAST